MGSEEAAMAVWGEGDARWIVEERKDGANVNNWHWTEKDVKDVSEERLKEALAHSSEALTEAGCCFTSVNKFSGFLNLINRKGKLNANYWSPRENHANTTLT